MLRPVLLLNLYYAQGSPFLPHTHQRIIWPKMSIDPRLQNLGVKGRFIDGIITQAKFYFLTEIRAMKINIGDTGCASQGDLKQPGESGLPWIEI